VWVGVPEDYVAGPGERIRNTYRLEVPWWLEWTPDEIMDGIVKGIVGLDAWFRENVLTRSKQRLWM